MKQAPSRGSKPEELSDEALVQLYSNLFFLLRRADQRAVSLFNQAAKGLQTTLPQSHVLYIATQVGAFPQGEIARQVAADEATTSLVVSTLVKRGWLNREADPQDRRRKVISATAEGRAHFSKLLPPFRSAIQTLEAPLGGKPGRLIHLLATLVNRGGGKISGPAGLGPDASQRLTIVHRSMQFLIRRTIQLIEQRCAPFLADSTMTIRQYVVLLIIGLHNDVGESQIASTIGLELSNTSFIARGLVTKKLIDVDESKRRRRYRVTEAGRDLLQTLEPKIYTATASFLNLLVPAERIELLKNLSEIVLGDGTSGPPALARIVQLPHWPTLNSPLMSAQSDLPSPETDDQRLLNELFAEAAIVSEKKPHLLYDLGPEDQSTLAELLRKILKNAKNQSNAAQKRKN